MKSPKHKKDKKHKHHRHRSQSSSLSRQQRSKKKDRKQRKQSKKHKRRHSSNQQIDNRNNIQNQSVAAEFNNIKVEDQEQQINQQYRKLKEQQMQRLNHNNNENEYYQAERNYNQRKIEDNSQNGNKIEEDIGDNGIKKQLPCFQPSGILLEYYNSREGISLKFHQPPEARKPQSKWRIYVFKGEQVLKPIILTQSCYLIGKDQRIADILTQNPSISRQHSVLQFRLIQKRTMQGDFQQIVKPYILDLQSTNGTFLNDQRIQSGRYYQLLHKDVLKFGFSDRQYVIVQWEGEDDQ